MAIESESGSERINNIQIDNMKNESCYDIKLENVTGPLVLSTISGDINITFGSINFDKPVSVNSISGDFDITLPMKTAANL